MKINQQTRFPHPVLCAQTNDYKKGVFHLGLQITESLQTGSLTLAYAVALDEQEIYSLVEQGRASIGIFVSCLETYFNELLPIAIDKGEVKIQAGRLKGRVILRPVIWSVGKIAGFNKDNLHEEFGSSGWTFSKGAILALGEESVINVGREKLSPMESIFSLSRNDDVPENQIRLQLDDDKIAILAPKQTHEKINRLRGTRSGKVFLLNSIYLPAVMDVLSCLRDDSSIYEGRRWCRIFTAKAQYMGINLETGNILEGAQKLLQSPFRRVQGENDLRYL
jgi:hypothetical protein